MTYINNCNIIKDKIIHINFMKTTALALFRLENNHSLPVLDFILDIDDISMNN